jgi:1,4-dihydroxy-2-naphthoate octaprenyltransferase
MLVPLGLAEPGAFVAFAAAPLGLLPIRLVLTRSDPPSLVRALIATARVELLLAVLIAVGLWWQA